MENYEIEINGQTYTVTRDDYGNTITELKMSIAQLQQIEAERAAAELLANAKQQAFIDNLPSWQQVSDAIDAATTIAALKVIIKKMARVLYWIARGTLT